MSKLISRKYGVLTPIMQIGKVVLAAATEATQRNVVAEAGVAIVESAMARTLADWRPDGKAFRASAFWVVGVVTTTNPHPTLLVYHADSSIDEAKRHFAALTAHADARSMVDTREHRRAADAKPAPCVSMLREIAAQHQ